MFNYIKSEVIKTKRISIRKLTVFIPLISIFLAVIFNFLGGKETFQYAISTTVNHWGLIWLSVFISLSAGLLDKLEKKSTKYITILGLPINLKLKEYSRIALALYLSFIASLVLIVFALFAKFTFLVSQNISSLDIIIAIFLTLLTSIWQIPFCLWLSRKTNVYATFLVNSMLALNIGSIFAPTSQMYYVPWAWALRVQTPFTHLHPNGLPLSNNSVLINSSPVFFILFILSILLFLLLSFLDAYSFSKLEVK